MDGGFADYPSFPGHCSLVPAHGHNRMTGLRKKMPQVTPAEYSTLINEAGYWLQQPEIREDPAASVLLAEEVRLNLQQLRSMPAKANLQQVVLDSGLPIDPSAELPMGSPITGKRKKHKRRRAISISTASTLAAACPAAYQFPFRV